MTLKVLVADDEDCAARALARLLAREGHAVETARDGEGALAAIRGAPPDVAFIDALLPRRDGHDVAFAVRSDPALAGVRIVLMAPRGRLADAEKARALGADAVLVKPFGYAAARAALARPSPEGAAP